MLEPVQGEAGVFVPPRDYLQSVRALCDQHGALLRLDEVQGGMGRPGKLFSHEHFGATPDAMSPATGIAGGLPLGALCATEALAKVMTPGTHASTFGGNPIATAAACEVIDMLDEAMLSRIGRAGARLGKAKAALAPSHPRRPPGETGQGLWPPTS